MLPIESHTTLSQYTGVVFYLNDVTLPQKYRVIGLQRRMNMAFVLILDVAGLIIKNIFFL
jgi:hypothetical protein